MSLDPEILPPEAAQAGAPPSTQLAVVSRPAGVLFEILPGDPLYETDRKNEEYRKASQAKATQRAYNSDWRHFAQWCAQRRLISLPAHPDTVGLYITYLASPENGEKPLKAATISRRLTSISTQHAKAGFDSPATMNHRRLRETLQGIRRVIGTGQARKKPLTRDRIVKILGILDGPIAAARDKALLLIGFAGALRRSELAAMKVEDIAWHRKGITINLPRSKTDQEAMGREIEILFGVHDLTCPVMALENWLKIGPVTEGLVFRSVGQSGRVGKGLHPNSVGRLVKDLVRRAKIATPQSYGGHSLRAGFVTEASANGATNNEIMKQTGHTTESMVRRYARADREDKQAAESKLGL